MTTPAGWYDDGSGRHRWWDGQQWTEYMRDVAPQQPEVAATVPVDQITGATERQAAFAGKPSPESGVFGKLGASVKKVAADRQAAKEEVRRQHAALEEAAGMLVTSGVFGSSTIQIYRGGYVRVAGPSDSVSPASIDNKTPYERLLSINFKPVEQEQGMDATPSGLEGVAVQAVTSFFKGGAGLMKGTVPGLAATGVAQLAKSMSGKSLLAITTDKEIHTLTNQVKNEWGILNVKREHEEVGRTLERVGNSVLEALGAMSPKQPAGSREVTVPSTGVLNQAATVNEVPLSTPSIPERLRELASLHTEGVLDDAEFAAAKAKLLGNL